jgi:hypothetical protein
MANLDQRVTALLADPERYFAAARERAQAIAHVEVEADLARRALARHNRRRGTTGAPKVATG